MGYHYWPRRQAANRAPAGPDAVSARGMTFLGVMRVMGDFARWHSAA